jgi:hypothetical protein
MKQSNAIHTLRWILVQKIKARKELTPVILATWEAEIKRIPV